MAANPNLIAELAKQAKTQPLPARTAQIVVNNGAGRVDVPLGTDASKLTKTGVQQIVKAGTVNPVQQSLPTAKANAQGVYVPTGTVPLSQRVKQSGGQANTPALPTAQQQNFADLSVKQKLDTLMRRQDTPNMFERVGSIMDASAKKGQGSFETLWESVGNWAGEKLMDAPVVGEWFEEQLAKPENAYLRESKTPLPYKTTKEIAYETAQRDIERAKQGLGKTGQAAVDLGSSISDMAFGMGVAGAAGLTSAIPVFMAQSAAGAIEEAKADGATDDEALAYGVLKGGLTAVTEKLVGGIPMTGKALTQSIKPINNVITKVTQKIAKNPSGAALIRRAFDVLGEGAEEALETAIDPLLQRLTYDENADFASGEDLLYSAVMGVLGAAVFNAPGAAVDTVNAAKTALPRKNATSNAQAQTEATPTADVQTEAEPTMDTQTEAEADAETEVGFMGPEVDSESDPSAEAKAHMDEMNTPSKQEVFHTKEWEEAAYQARQAGERLGVKVEITKDLPSGVNGKYENGTIYISENAKNPLKETFVHELTHHLEATNTYGALSEYAVERMAADLTKKGTSIDEYRQAIKNAYAAKGKTIDDAAADKEIVANYIEQKLFNDSREIAKLANKHRSLVQVIRDWFTDLRVKFRGKAEEKELLRAQRLFEKALRETGAKGYRTSGDGAYSFAGEKAETADLEALERAKQMQTAGADANTILRDTGWFVGRDGKWRFEIDDSGMQYYRGGDAAFRSNHPEYAEYQTLMSKMLNGTITDAEFVRMQELHQTWGNEYQRLSARLKGGTARLTDIIDHSALFEAYPDLKYVRVEFVPLEEGENAKYNPFSLRLTINEKLKNAPEEILLHEIQHAIQQNEDFTRGASPLYWADYIGFAETDNNGRTPFDLYRNTSGEIEARDAANRMKLTADERRAQMPDLGDENTVFADGAREAYSINPNFASAYRAWAERYPNQNISFSVGTTSKALQEIGVNERTIKWDSKKIRETKQKHPEITDTVIEQVPNLLENPIIVMHSKNPQYQSRITMFGEVYGDNGLPVMAVVELMPTDRAGNYSLDEIKVASTHTRMDRKNPSAMTQTQNMINSSEILYVEPDKNKTNRWLSTTGLQLPFAANYGLNKTLAQIGVGVNGENSIDTGGQMSIDLGEDDPFRASSGRTADEIKADMQSAVDQYSAMRENKQPGVREATYPHETAHGKTMHTAQTIGGSNLVDDRMELDIEEAILAGKFAYEVSGDKAALRDANKRIEDGDYSKLAEQAKGLFADGYRLKKDQVVFVERMIQEASKHGDVETAMALITDLAAYGTEQGQNIQALSMIRRMTPEGKLMVLKRQVDKANKMTQVDRESKGEIKQAEQEIKAIKKDAFAGLKDIGVDESMDIETAQQVVDEAIADETAKAGQSGLPTAKKQQLQQKKQKLSEAEKKIRELEKAAKNLKNPVTIPTETVEAMLKAKSPSEQNDLYNKALDEIASQIVSSLPDKVNAWRYLAMLGNPRTHIRNLTGNTTMLATNAAKNIVKRGFELIPGTKKTTVLKASKDAKAFAKEDFELNRDLITGGGKMNASDELRDRMKIFENKGLEALRKFNTNAMEAEDTFFMRRAYESALARYITANKKSKAFLESGSAAAESFLQKARDYAIKEAREVTFHDDSAVADWLSGITRSAKDDKLTVKAAKAMVEGVLPFKKTPINVAKRGIEYSPVSIATAINKFAKGDAEGAVNDLAKGTTGTIMMAVGMALAHFGMLRTKNEEKDEVLDTQENEQNYSLRIPNADGTVTSVSLDALMPAAMPLLVGVEVNKLLKEEDMSVMSVLESLTGIADPIVENSMLDGLNDMLTYIGYSDSAIGAIATDMGESYLEQFRPSVLRQVQQSIDPTVRTTYAPKDSPIGKGVETHLRSLSNAAPVLPWAAEKLDEATDSDRFSLQPKIDVWGNEVKKADSFGERLVQNMVLPFNVKKVTSDPVNEELRRLYHVDSTYSVLPKAADKSFAYRNENYYATPAEYTALAKEKGQTSHEYLKTTIKDAGYKALPDAKKADVVSNLMKYANYKAKQDFFDGRGVDYVTDTFNGVEEAVARGMTAEDYYIMKAQMDGGQTSEEKTAYYMGMLTNEQKKFVERLPKDAASASWLERIALSNQGEDAKTTSAFDDLLIGEKKEKVDYSDMASVYLSLIDSGASSKIGDKYYEYAKPAGVSVEDYMVAYYAQKDVTYPAKTKGAKAAAEAAAIDKALPKLSKKQREALYQAFK